jgi:hypothetical protein
MLYTVDIKKCLLLVGGIRMQGFADGEAFVMDLDEDLYSKVTGADGDTTRARRHGQAANCKITLLQTSPSNDILMAFAVADRVNNAGVVPVMIKDLLGTTAAFSAYAWVKKPPQMAFGKEVTNREWMLDVANVEYFNGGNIPQLFA